MKVTNIIYVGVLIALAAFTTLYFVNPRKVIVEKPVWEQIPNKLSVQFKAAPPDTIWKIKATQLAKRFDKMSKKPGAKPTVLGPDSLKLVVSQKTFRKALLGKTDKTLVNIKSTVRAYSISPVKYFENDLTVTPHKINLNEEYPGKPLEVKNKTKSKFWAGVGVGAGALGGVILVGFLTGVF